MPFFREQAGHEFCYKMKLAAARLIIRFLQRDWLSLVILNDGTILGSKNGGVVRRAPDGTITNIPCGNDVHDANEAGDILTNAGGIDGMRIWHEGQCFVLGDGRFTRHFIEALGSRSALWSLALNCPKKKIRNSLNCGAFRHR